MAAFVSKLPKHMTKRLVPSNIKHCKDSSDEPAVSALEENPRNENMDKNVSIPKDAECANPVTVINVKGETTNTKTNSVNTYKNVTGVKSKSLRYTHQTLENMAVSGDHISLSIKSRREGELSACKDRKIIRVIKSTNKVSLSPEASICGKNKGVIRATCKSSDQDSTNKESVRLIFKNQDKSNDGSEVLMTDSDKYNIKCDGRGKQFKKYECIDFTSKKIGKESPRMLLKPKILENKEESKNYISVWAKRKRKRPSRVHTNMESQSIDAQACSIKVEPVSYEDLRNTDGEFEPDLSSVLKLTSVCKNEPEDGDWQSMNETKKSKKVSPVESNFANNEPHITCRAIEEDAMRENGEKVSVTRKPSYIKNKRRCKVSLGPQIKIDRSGKSLDFQCTICGYTSRYKNSVKRHIESCRTGTEAKGRSCIFPDCEVKFYHVSQMIKHMELMHSASIGVKNIKFSNFQEFLAWKDKEEIANFTYFTKHRGDMQKKGGVYSVYICQNDGGQKSHRKSGQPARLTSRKHRKGTVKTGATCPSRMFVLTGANEVTVKYFYSHNHELKFENTQFHPITQKSSEYIKRRFSLGASPKQVQDELRSKAVCRDKKAGDDACVKGQLISLRTLNAMKHEFLSSFRLDKEDANSVFLLVKEWEKRDFNPIFLYKPQFYPIVIGRSNRFFPLEKELFFIALQTKGQIEILNSNIHFLCIDTTFSIDKNGFYLINLIVHDEFGKVLPVAHFITNKKNEEILSYFLLSIRDRCQDLRIHGIMTDLDTTGLEAAKSVLGCSGSHVVCQWHIKRSWQKKVENLVYGEYHLEVMSALTAMLQETDRTALTNMILRFKVHYEDYIPKFIDYFQSCIANQHELWASCYRDPVTSNVSSMYCKSFHDKLEIFFSKSKTKKRVDDLLLLLLRIDEANAMQKCVESSITCASVSDCVVGMHAKSLDIPDWDVIEVEGSWRIVSQEDRNKVFEVSKVQNECSEVFCSEVCQEFPCDKLCCHLYACSCGSNTGLCEHIHRVHSGKSNVIIICSPDADSSSLESRSKVLLHEDPLEPEPTEEHKKSLLRSARENLGQLSTFVGQAHIQRFLLPHIASVLDELVKKCKDTLQT